jgi:hypothetical protein
MTDGAELGRFGYRFFVVAGDGADAIRRPAAAFGRWAAVQGVDHDRPPSLRGPEALSPWAPGWQSGGCRSCATAGTEANDDFQTARRGCGCGLVFFPTVD